MNNSTSINQPELDGPVLISPVPVKELVEALSGVADQTNPPKSRKLYAQRTAIHYFEKFLEESSGSSRISPDEAMLAAFMDWMMRGKSAEKPLSTWSSTVSKVRVLINQLPPTLLRRPLLTPKQQKALTPFPGVNEKTREIFQYFLDNGRKVKFNQREQAFKLTNVRLATSNRKTLVSACRTILTCLGKDDITSLTLADTEELVRRYDGRENKWTKELSTRQTGENLLAFTKPFFRYLVIKGYIEFSPVEDGPQRIVGTRDDFVPAEGIERLMSKIATLPLRKPLMSDFLTIRNHLITFTLAYDFQLRVHEISLLKITDVHCPRQDGSLVEITIRGEIQKGGEFGKKLTELSCSCYPMPTQRLMHAYLKLREKIDTKTDALLVSEHGAALGVTGCYEAIKTVSGAEDVRAISVNDVVGYPHLYRHSFSTLNAETIGLCMTDGELQTRMRHESLKTTRTNYIHNNPLLRRQKHRNMLKRSETPVAVEPASSTAPTAGLGFDMSEREATRFLRSASIYVTSDGLWEAAVKVGKSIEHSLQRYYDREWVTAIALKYHKKETAIALMGLSKSGYANWVKYNNADVLLMGRTSMVLKTDVDDYLKNKPSKAPGRTKAA